MPFESDTLNLEEGRGDKFVFQNFTEYIHLRYVSKLGGGKARVPFFMSPLF